MSKAKKKELGRAVKEILFREWDPMGINSNPACESEYNSYANTIVRFLEAGADEYKVTGHLRNLRRVCMGLSSVDEERDCHIARRLINLVG
jgi:hypothetical protein